MESDLPNFDLPSDYIVGEGYGINLLKRYKNFPCRVKAGFFILCVKGIMQATINGNLQNIGENDLITLPPGYFMEILDFSPDIHIYYAGFSSEFIEGINLMKSTEHLLPIIMENPIIRLSPLQACSYKMFYESSILSYASPKTLANKEIVKAVLTMFLQGATEIYKMQNNLYLSSQSRKYEIYQEFLQLVMKYYTIHHGTSFYAEHLGLSLPHFCSTIKKVAGNTPLEVIASIILMDAKSRLKSTNEPVKNIALSLGFNNISFFNKFFKQHTGVTPTEEAKKLSLAKLSNGPHRFPAFWGPGYDWTPDHNWGGSGMIGLQEMLLQTNGEQILLFPAWPKEWNVHFKLHAPGETTVEATLKNGKVTDLKVLPESRKKDIVIMIENEK